MLDDIRVYNGETGEWQFIADDAKRAELLAIVKDTYWELQPLGDEVYYQTFEMHIYRVIRITPTAGYGWGI